MAHTSDESGVIYCLLLDRPLSDNHTSQAYIGFTSDLSTRLSHHARGIGARYTRAAKQRGIHWRIVRAWRGTRSDERRIKRMKNGRLIATGERDVRFLVELTVDEINDLVLPF